MRKLLTQKHCTWTAGQESGVVHEKEKKSLRVSDYKQAEFSSPFRKISPKLESSRHVKNVHVLGSQIDQTVFS